MSEAEKLYDATLDNDSPPVIIDVLFVVVMVIVHTKYIMNFTTFSLAYLEARILEMKEATKKSSTAESIRYWRTVREWRPRILEDSHVMDEWDEKMICEMVKGTVWRQLLVLRTLLRVVWAIVGWMMFILYLVATINVLYGMYSVYLVYTLSTWSHTEPSTYSLSISVHTLSLSQNGWC